MSQHPEIDEAEREAHEGVCVYDSYPHPDCKCLGADCCPLHEDIAALASLARAAEERADKQANDFDVLSQQYLKRTEAAEARVRELEAKGGCDHVFEANHGMFDSSHPYCTKCGRAE